MVVGYRKDTAIYDAQSGALLTIIKDAGGANSIAFSAEGTRLAVCDEFGKSTIFDLNTNLPLFP
jgi:sugar lactone lactonase YvrE